MHQSLSFVLLIDVSTVRDLFDYYMTWLSFLMSSMHICSIFYIILSIVLYRLVQLMQILTPDAPYNFYFKMCTEMLWIARMRDASNFSNIYIYIYIFVPFNFKPLVFINDTKFVNKNREQFIMKNILKESFNGNGRKYIFLFYNYSFLWGAKSSHALSQKLKK